MSMLVQRAADIEWDKIGDISVVGLSAGASAPEIIVDEIIASFRDRFDVRIELAETAVETENFLVNREIRDVELTVQDMAFVNGENRVAGIPKLAPRIMPKIMPKVI
jgi:4-hydroxy-3-methylbut-2-enyl diphosphate reductase